MRTLRVVLAGALALALLGGLGGAVAADSDCSSQIEFEEQLKNDLTAVTAEVEDLRRRLAVAERRQEHLDKMLASVSARVIGCLDQELAADMAKENSAAIEQGRGTGPLDLPEWGLKGLPAGDHVTYVIHCKGTNKATGAVVTVPPRVATTGQQLREQIALHPDGCVSNQYDDRQLVIEVFTKNAATGRQEEYATVTGKPQP